jgi:hypothetical protein
MLQSDPVKNGAVAFESEKVIYGVTHIFVQDKLRLLPYGNAKDISCIKFFGHGFV